MKLDVFLTPGELVPGDLANRTAAVIDVLRATSTIVEAFAAGVKAIFPVASIEEALRLANSIGRDQVLLCGERKCLPIEGFDLGNSPREFTTERVAGKTLVMSTTNGTNALSLASAATRVLVASFLNLDAVVEELAGSERSPVLICSGRERRFALEDAVCAGYIASRLAAAREGRYTLNDGAKAAMLLSREFSPGEEFFARTAAGQGITAAELTEDLAFCAQLNRHAIVPVYSDRHIALASSAAAAAPER